MALFGLVWPCMALYGLKYNLMVFYGRTSSFLAVIDPHSFGLVNDREVEILLMELLRQKGDTFKYLTSNKRHGCAIIDIVQATSKSYVM